MKRLRIEGIGRLGSKIISTNIKINDLEPVYKL
jgi:hypothetical protein